MKDNIICDLCSNYMKEVNKYYNITTGELDHIEYRCDGCGSIKEI